MTLLTSQAYYLSWCECTGFSRALCTARLACAYMQAGKKRSDDSLTHATLDMLQQLSSPVERSVGGGPQKGPVQRDVRRPGHSSKVSTDMESICEAKMLPGSLSPLSSAPSAHSLR